MMTRRKAAPVPHAEFFPAEPAPGGLLRPLRAVVGDARELFRFRAVIQNMVAQELTVRYQRSMLGFFWTLLHPILMMATQTFFFAQLFRLDIKSFAIYIFSGMLPWNFFGASLVDGSMCIISNEGLIRKIYLPKAIFPLTRVLINLVTFILSMAALFLILMPIGAHFSWPMILLPVAGLLFAAFTLGLTLLVATMNTFYRDCGHLVTVILQAWYFATPIMWMPERMNIAPEKQWLFWLNPAFPFIRLFQDILSKGIWPHWTIFASAAGIAAVSLGIGYAAFKLNEDKLVFRL